MGKISNKRRRALKNMKGHALDDDTYMDKENADQIDAFHKQREMIPLDVNKDIKVSDDDAKEPIFDLEAYQDGDHCNDSEDDNEDFTDAKDKGFSGKIVRQLKYLKERFGGVEDEISNDDKEKNNLWGRNKKLYYGADNTDYELQSSDEGLLMEEREVMKIERERAKTPVKSDFGLENSDEEPRKLEGLKGRNFLQMLLAKKRAMRGPAYVSKKNRIVHRSRSSKDHGSSSVPQNSGKLAPTGLTKKNGLKIISGNKDALKRDDSAKRPRKHEPRKYERRKHEPSKHEPRKTDDGKKDHCSSGIYEVGNNLQRKNEKQESADKFGREAKKQRIQKIAIPENVYMRPKHGPDEHASFVRQPVCREIMENRGLTRYRKRLTKNPRKKYKLKHEKAMMRRKGQVPDIRRPTGPYGGEPTGINIHVSRSIRLDY